MEKPKVNVNSELTIEIGGKTRVVTLVKSNAIDLNKGFISKDSPLGKVLLGKSVGDTAEFESPSGKVVKVSILKIRENE